MKKKNEIPKRRSFKTPTMSLAKNQQIENQMFVKLSCG